MFTCFRYSFAQNCFDGSLGFFGVVEDMISLLTYFEPEHQDIINRLKHNDRFEFLQDKPAKAKLLQIALRWEKVFLGLGYLEENKYFLRNTNMNPRLFDFIYSLENYAENKIIKHVSAYNNVVTVFGTYEKDEFHELMKNYDSNYERCVLF
jgi:hypothetical protein